MELSGVPSGDPFAGYLEEDSDLEYSDCSGGSSDEEDCTVGYQSRGNQQQQEQSSEDEFEKEMAGEILSVMKGMVSSAAASVKAKKKPGNSSAPQQATQGTSKATAAESKYYDDIYFSSGSSGDESDVEEAAQGGGRRGSGTDSGGGGSGAGSSSSRKKVKKLSNDELFYDPNMDEEDEKWVRRQRMAYHNVRVAEQLEVKKRARQAQRQLEEKQGGLAADGPSKGQRGGAPEPVPKSDAVLNCPACLSTLCLDCQRHDIYANQYRAMFVLNCRVMRDEVLTYVPKPPKKSRKRQRGAATASGQQQSDPSSSEENRYHPVRCDHCNTEVAVMDTDEVFHFFNVLPSATS